MAVASSKQLQGARKFGFYDLTGPDDVVRFVQEKRVTVRNSFDFIDIAKTLTEISRARNGSEINFQAASLSLDASSKVYGLRVDNLHNSLVQVSNNFRLPGLIKADTEPEQAISPVATLCKKRDAKRQPRSSYVATDLSKTTGVVDIDWSLHDIRGNILSRVNGREGSMGRIMSFLPPADIHSIDITQENIWFEGGTIDDVCTLCPIPVVPLDRPISRFLENFDMDLPSEEHLSKDRFNASLEQQPDIHEYEFDPNAYGIPLDKAPTADVEDRKTEIPNLAVLSLFNSEDSQLPTSGSQRFTIDGTPIITRDTRGRPRKPIDLQFVPYLEKTTRIRDESESPEDLGNNPFSEAMPSLPGSGIRLSEATFAKWAINCKKLRHIDPLEILGHTFDSITERFAALFFLRTHVVPIRGCSGGDVAEANLPEVGSIKMEPIDPVETDPLEMETRTWGPDYVQLIGAPGIIASTIPVGHLTAQKKFNLKQISQAMWDTLALTCRDDEPVGDRGKNEKLFSYLYAAMQPALSACNREAMSPQLAFVALLSLANSHKLLLVSADEVDVRISRMTPPVRLSLAGPHSTDTPSWKKGSKRNGSGGDDLKYKRLRLANGSSVNH